MLSASDATHQTMTTQQWQDLSPVLDELVGKLPAARISGKWLFPKHLADPRQQFLQPNLRPQAPSWSLPNSRS